MKERRPEVREEKEEEEEERRQGRGGPEGAAQPAAACRICAFYSHVITNVEIWNVKESQSVQMQPVSPVCPDASREDYVALAQVYRIADSRGVMSRPLMI